MFARNLSMLGTLAAAMLASTVAHAQISDDVVKIGVLTDMNGPASTPTGQGSVTAAQMACEEYVGTYMGKPIIVISGDHQLKPDIGAGIARRWYDVDHVDLIVDVPVSAVGLAVQNIANDKKRMFITHSTGAADFHGKFCSPYAIQWVFDTRALAVGTAQEVVKRGGDSWFFITDDYAFGHSLERDASAMITKSGGKCSARFGRRLPRPICRRLSFKRRPRRPRSSASPPGRQTTSTRSRPPPSSASSRAASRWPPCSR